MMMGQTLEAVVGRARSRRVSVVTLAENGLTAAAGARDRRIAKASFKSKRKRGI
jgi:hypothetical protein